MNVNSHSMFFNKPAREWVEALPVGNGKTGAMVNGGIEEEVLNLNYDELWSGTPDKLSNPKAYKFFRKARELALAGKYSEAQNLLENNFHDRWTNAYLPFGDIIIKTKTENATKYSRMLSLKNAIASSGYKDGNNTVRRECFASFPAGCLIYRIEADEVIETEITMTSQLKHSVGTENGYLYLDGTCFSISQANVDDKKMGFPDVYLEGDEHHGIDFRGAVKVITDGKYEIKNNTIFSSGKTLTLFFACESSYNGYEKHPFFEGKPYKNVPAEIISNAAEKNYSELKAEHIADFSKYYDRVDFEISESSDRYLLMPRRFTKTPDKTMYELLFNYGRYLTISSSRPGSQATNLQGIWNNSVDPPWQSNYTININTQMNYYPVLPCNLAEFDEPLQKLVTEVSQTGKKTAKEYYNAGGFCSHHNTDIWRFSCPVPGASNWSFWPMSGGWLCHNLFEHYEYTLDKKYLRNVCYPVMKNASRFYLDTLTDDGKGRLIFAPSTSPENTFYQGRDHVSVSQTTTMTMGIIKDLFRNFEKACAVLNKSPKELEEIKEKTPLLIPYETGANGRLKEWYNDERDCEIHHRHVSHLYSLYPANLINPIETPELTEAAKKTLEIRGDDGTGWSLAWKICFWARLMDGNHAQKLIDLQLRPVKTYRPRYGHGGGSYPNMFDAHPPFQIDGNFGACAGIAEMLVQRIEDKIYLLPALPDDWADGHVKGLKVKGNLTVDIYWKDGKITDYKIKGKLGDTEIVKCR